MQCADPTGTAVQPGTMQDAPLSIRMLFDYGRRYHLASSVLTYDGANVQRRSFGDVAAGVSRLAAGLSRLGIRPGDRVGSFCWSHDQHLEAYFAVPMMGAVLHTINVRLAADQIAFIVNHAGDKVIIVDHSLVPVLAASAGKFRSVTHFVVVGPIADGLPGTVLTYADLLAMGGEDFTWPPIDERAASSLCYTSGTTGNPKGVAYTHRSTVLHSLVQAGANVYALSHSDRVLATASMFHANSWGLPYTAWMVGADLILPGRFLQPEHLVRLIETERATISAGVPTIWNDILRHAEKAGSDLSSLRAVILGGAPAPRALMERYQKRFGVTVLQGYGMTETSPLVALSWPPRGAPKEADFDYRQRTGRPVPGVEVRLVDESGKELPWDDASVGEMQLRGPWVTGSYFGENADDRFDGGWLRTGDVARIDREGYIQITDRAKDIIKSGGEWISSVDLENALSVHPRIVEAAVVGVPDERWQERPLACIVLAEGQTQDVAELARFLSGKVARWWIPERWSFVTSIPRTSVGKVDKKVIRQLYAENRLTVSYLNESARKALGTPS